MGSSGHNDERIDLQVLGPPYTTIPPPVLGPPYGTFPPSQSGSVAPRRDWNADLDFAETAASSRNTSISEPGPGGLTSASVDFLVHFGNFSSGNAVRTLSELREACLGNSVSALAFFAWRIVRRNAVFLAMLVSLAVSLSFLGALTFNPLSWKAWAAFAIVSVVLSLLVVNALPTHVVMLIGVTAMLVLQIISPAEALEGFSNTGVASVAVLFIVADGIQRTSVLQPAFRKMLGKPRRLWIAQLRLMLPVALISAFLNNTPVVALLIPITQAWSRRAGFPLSKLLMPLNNAAILGGTVTLLGTSTNLVVAGLVTRTDLVEDNGDPISLHIFGISRIGLIVLVAGLVYMITISPFLLADKGHGGVDAIIKNPREYTVPLLVSEKSPIVGETVTSAGLRQLQGLYLVEVTREDGSVIPAVSPDTRIRANDVLLFAGVVETVTELYHIPGIVPATDQSSKVTHERHRRRLVELVISATSFLEGKTAKETKFRSRFNAAIIAVHRRGEHVKEKIADIRLHSGDTLLIETGEEFIRYYGKDSNFALVSEVSGSQPPRTDLIHMIIAALTAVVMIAVVTAGKLDLLTASAAATVILVVTGCLTIQNAAEAVNMPVIVTIAASFGVSKGMEVSGAADALAITIVSAFKAIGVIGLLFGIFVGTAGLSSILTNNAAVGALRRKFN
jgi:di/tricarboxylate transporter